MDDNVDGNEEAQSAPLDPGKSSSRNDPPSNINDIKLTVYSSRKLSTMDMDEKLNANIANMSKDNIKEKLSILW